MIKLAVGAVLVVGAVLFIYHPALGAYFYEDDFQWLVTRWTFHPADLLAFGDRANFYRPVIELYFWIGSPLFGGSPWWFHAANIALHLANGALVFFLAMAIGWRRRFAFAAALLFVVQPGYVEGVAWVGALAEPMVTFFGCASMLALLSYRRTARTPLLAASVVLFGLAMLSHQSAVVLLPILMLADFMTNRSAWRPGAAIRLYLPFVAIVAAYFLIELRIDSRHQLIESGEYRFDARIIRHTFDYISTLYVGERSMAEAVGVAGLFAWVLVKGSARAKLAIIWMILAILPFAPFETSSVSRYAYLPAVGLALLLAEGLDALHRWLARREFRAREAVVVLLLAGMTVRFGGFASRNVTSFADRTETYRTFLADLRQRSPTLPDGAVITIDAPTDAIMAQRYLEAAVQWEYRNPTLRVMVR